MKAALPVPLLAAADPATTRGGALWAGGPTRGAGAPR